MKITKTELSKLIKEELEQVQAEQQLNENPAMIAQVVKHLPQILQVVQALPQIMELVKSFQSGAAGGAGGTADSTPDLSPASE